MKRILALALTFALFWAVMSAMATNVPGTPADPVVTVGYITEKFAPVLTSEADGRVNAALNGKNAELNALMNGISGKNYEKYLVNPEILPLLDAVKAKASQAITDTGGTFRLVSATAGQILNLAQGSSVMLISGVAKLAGYPAADLTTSDGLAAGTELTANHEVFFPDGGGALSISTKSELLVNGAYAFYAPVYVPKYKDLAVAMQEMGLLRGTGSGFDLGRPATRVEALCMMLNFLGELDVSQSYTGTSPFTDVPNWAKPIVAYAYSKGYTKGVSAAKFGSDDTSTPDQYVTMLLRVMGYDDSQGDFFWETAVAFAVSAGMLTTAEQTSLNKLFYRDQMVYVSYYALDAWIKGGASTFQQTLISRGILSAEAVASARGKVTRTRGM